MTNEPQKTTLGKPTGAQAFPKSTTRSVDESAEIRTRLDARDFEAAEKLIYRRLRNNKEDANAYYFLGVLHQLRGDIKKAAASLKQTLKLDPRHTDAAICLSVLYNDVGEYDEARKVFEGANQSVAHRSSPNTQEIDRKFSVKHLELADLYFRYRRYDEAIEDYGKAILLDPKNLEIRIRIAKAYAKKGFLSRAIQELQQLRDENPRFIEARVQLGLLHYSQKNILDAELEWEQVLDIDEHHQRAKEYLEMAKSARLSPNLF